MRRLLEAWDVFLVIMAAGLLTGLVTFMATDGNPPACRHAVSHMHVPLRSFTWVCAHP